MSGFAKIKADVVKAIPREEKFREDIEEVLGVELRKDIRQQKKNATPIDMDPIDYMMFDKGSSLIKAYIEIKVRPKYKSTSIPTAMIDHRKMVAFQLKSLTTHLPVYYAVRWNDRDLVYEFNPAHKFPIEHGGRTKNTRSEYDIKEVQYIPMNYFRELKKEILK